MVTFELRIAIHTTDGRIGRQTINADGAIGPLVWEGDPDGDGATESVEIAVFHRCGEEQIDLVELTGDEWRDLEDAGSGLTAVVGWLNHPDLEAGPEACVHAAVEGCDPPGWTNAHERVIDLLSELEAAEKTRSSNEAQMQVAQRALEIAIGAFDRMAEGESFNAVCEATGATRAMTSARHGLKKALSEA